MDDASEAERVAKLQTKDGLGDPIYLTDEEIQWGGSMHGMMRSEFDDVPG